MHKLTQRCTWPVTQSKINLTYLSFLILNTVCLWFGQFPGRETVSLPRGPPSLLTKAKQFWNTFDWVTILLLNSFSLMKPTSRCRYREPTHTPISPVTNKQPLQVKLSRNELLKYLLSNDPLSSDNFCPNHLKTKFCPVNHFQMF